MTEILIGLYKADVSFMKRFIWKKFSGYGVVMVTSTRFLLSHRVSRKGFVSRL